MSAPDERYMQECLSLALGGRGYVSPNPLVGAVLVRNGRILSRGWHRRFGGPHAEVECLSALRGDPKGATLYVNLEPCSFHGKTPPCTDLIIRSGIRRVVAAMRDPNPRVCGRGFRRLRRAGVTVRAGVLVAEARELNRMFITSIQARRPFVHMKVAQSLDGKIARESGGKRWITGPASRRLVHAWRSELDAVLVGAGTVRTDDPLLTVRSVRGRNPAVVVLDGRCTISPEASLFGRGRRVFVAVDRVLAGARKKQIVSLEKAGATVLLLPGGGDHRIDVRRVMRELYRNDIGSVLVEGGGEVFTQFLRSGIVDELSMMIAPKLIGHGPAAFPLLEGRLFGRAAVTTAVRTVGPDLLFTARKA